MFRASVSIFRMIQGLIVSRAVYVAATLGIADLLEESSRPADELARLTDSHPSSLYRILRLLTALGRAMLTDGLGGLRAFDHILDAVRTGQPAFESAFGMGVFEFLAGHPEAAPSLTPLSRSEPPHSRRASPSTRISRGCAWSPTSAGGMRRR